MQTLEEHHSLVHGFCAHGELRGNCVMYDIRVAEESLLNLSKWIDSWPANAERDPEAQLWGRVGKVGEEFGEVIEALIGATNQNPRKGVTHGTVDVRKELFDVALTALGGVIHLEGNRTPVLPAFLHFIASVWERAQATMEKEDD